MRCGRRMAVRTGAPSTVGSKRNRRSSTSRWLERRIRSQASTRRRRERDREMSGARQTSGKSRATGEARAFGSDQCDVRQPLCSPRGQLPGWGEPPPRRGTVPPSLPPLAAGEAATGRATTQAETVPVSRSCAGRDRNQKKTACTSLPPDLKSPMARLPASREDALEATPDQSAEPVSTGAGALYAQTDLAV
jgi:hypothetical protein